MLLLSSKQLTVALYALIVSGCSFSWSFTVTDVNRWQSGTREKATHATFTLAMVASSTPPNFDRDSSLMQSVIGARTASELFETLRGAFPMTMTNNSSDCSSQGEAQMAEFTHLDDRTIEKTLTSFPPLSTDVLAAALRRLALMSAREKHNKDDVIQKHLLTALLDIIGNQMVLVQRQRGQLGLYALADILQALAILNCADVYADSNDWEDLTFDMDKLVDSTVEMLTDISEIKQLGPIRLLQCLQAMAKLYTTETPLHFRIYEQLLKPNASSRIPARFLAYGMDALSTIVGYRADDSETVENDTSDSGRAPETFLLVRAFMRRLRKQKVREQATINDLCRALMATDDLWHSGGLRGLEDEAAIFGFTALQATIQKRKDCEIQIHPGEMATMVSAWATLTNNEKEDIIMDELLLICIDDCVLERSSLLELERIISSVQQLKIKSHATIMRIAGDRLLCLTAEGRVFPKAFNSVLRLCVLSHRKDTSVMKPYMRACEMAFLDKTFVAKCNAGEIANFLWFASIAHWRHEDVLGALGQRILDPELCDHCTPKLASRILATYTSILSLPRNVTGTSSTNDDFLRGLTAELFHSYGGHLLTSKLSPAEVSSALYAYAKASYFYDMGIIDHLVSLMAGMSCSRNPPSVRQMTQSLWSSGKMSVWETVGDTPIGDAGEESMKGSEPPFLESAHTIAVAIASRADELTPPDVTQCIWALGRLGSPNRDTVVSIARRAAELTNDMNAVEVSNILWGLSRLNFVDDYLVDKLMTRLTSTGLILSPKEAAMALYALARLGVGDEEVFARLSGVMIEKVDETSAQAVANTLWAYRAVELKPPQQLLIVWAAQKLGLTSVRSIDIDL